MKHFGIFSNSGDVQTALDEQTLLNPYVAKVSGALDYNTIEPSPECYVEDSDGNTYLPTGKTEEGDATTYSFDFQADVDATWTLFHNGAVVEATEGNLSWYYRSQDSEQLFDSQQDAGMLIEDVAPSSPASYDEPIQQVELTFEYNVSEGTYGVNCSIYIPYSGEEPSSSGSES